MSASSFCASIVVSYTQPGNFSIQLSVISEHSNIQAVCITGLGFQQLLGSDSQPRSARYAQRPVIATAYPEGCQALPWSARALELNRFLLDSTNPDGSPCQYQHDSHLFPDRNATQDVTISKRALVTAVVNDAVSVRVRQLFVDGNHRTAIVTTYEKLADAGWLLSIDPVDVYILISNRKQEEWRLVKIGLVKMLMKHVKRCNMVSLEARQIFAERVKLIADINSSFEAVDTYLSNASLALYAKRSRWRAFRRKSKKRHAQFTCLYGCPHIK